MRLHESLSRIWGGIQKNLFPWLEEELGELTQKEKKLIATLELVRVEDYVEKETVGAGRPKKDRAKIARVFVAKAVYNAPTTKHMIDMVSGIKNLRLICGWDRAHKVPSEATFSRAFDEFALSELADRVHAALIEKTLTAHGLTGHISRDSSAIEAREKRKKKKEPKEKKPAHKKGRPRKGEEREKEKSRLERQKEMTREEMIAELPADCDTGCKTDSKGYKKTWRGYKLHADVADGQIPVSCILTSASLHDSQAALPLAGTTADRVENMYDLMDAAYWSPIIIEHSKSLGHIPIIDINPGRNKELKAQKEEMAAEKQRLKIMGLELPEAARYKNRSGAERVFGRLKDEYGGRSVRVRGHAKVKAHLMFGILALTADQLLKLVC